MYSKEFWNNIYKKHITDAPWMSREWAEGGIRLLENYIPDASKNSYVLDYGCGNALISDHFAQKGYKQELAEISDELADMLKMKYGNCTEIYIVSSPDEIIGECRYDYIFAWGLFHHINPNLWRDFLGSFRRLLKKDALIFISGWDDSDEILKKEKKLGRFTGQPVWFINMLEDILKWEKDLFEVIESKVVPFRLKPFTQERMIRFIVAKKK